LLESQIRARNTDGQRIKTYIQTRKKTNLSSRPRLPLGRLAGRKQAENQKREVGMKVVAGSQRHRPHLFIGGETQWSKNFEPNGKTQCLKGI
jgi:hypothetical protein